jgi:tetratricopeptide (TPR) repeat protein
VRGHGAAPAFEGKILAVLAGVQVLIGQIQEATANSRKARELLNPTLNAEDYWWATGNLAFALTQHQEYDEAVALFVDVLRFYESQGNLYEIARTLQLSIELDVQRRSAEGVLEKVDRLIDLRSHLIKTTGPTELTLGFLGTLGNALNALAHQLDGTLQHVPSSLAGTILQRATTLRARALVHFRELEALAAQVDRERLNVGARAQQAYTLWHMNQLAEAEQVLTKLVDEGHVTFGKAMADAQFNRALILEELGRIDEARGAMDDARTRYLNCGDMNSAQDAKVHLERLARGSGSGA